MVDEEARVDGCKRYRGTVPVEKGARSCAGIMRAREAADMRRCRSWHRRQPSAQFLSALCMGLALCRAQLDNLPPANVDGSCQPGYESCLSGYGDAYQRLGSVPVPRESWNRTYTALGKEYVEAGAATGCVFSDNQTLIFANTQYKSILAFRTAGAGMPWARSASWPTPCAPRGVAVLPGDFSVNRTNVLFACTDEGRVYNMSMDDGLYSVLSSGIDFSPHDNEYRKSQHYDEFGPPNATVLESTILQCATTSQNMIMDIKILPKGDKAILVNKNHNHMIVIDLSISEYSGTHSCNTIEIEDHCREYGWYSRFDEQGRWVLSDDQNRSLFACCNNVVAASLDTSCCNWAFERLKTFSKDLLFPTGMDISPDGAFLSTGTAYPSGKIFVTALEDSSPYIGDVETSLDSSLGLSLHSYSPTYSRDGSGLYVARQADDRVEKYVSDSNGDLQANPLLIRELTAPRSMCVSADSKLMGIAGVAEVGVLGKPGCNLVDYCRPCLDVPAWNATFYRQCEWRCIGGFYFTETADGSAAGEPRARVLPSTGRAGYCQECPAGTYAEFASARFLNISDCSACPLGKYSSTAALSSPSGCRACAAGSFSNITTGATTCFLCPPDTYSSQVGATNATSCRPCAVNTTSPAGSNSSASCQPA